MAKKATISVKGKSSTLKVNQKKSEAAKKAAITKKLKKEQEVILNDEKIKDLLDEITHLTVQYDQKSKDYDNLIRTYEATINSSNQKASVWESKYSDMQLEMKTQHTMFENVARMADAANEALETTTTELENMKQLYSDLMANNTELREKLDSKQIELERRNIEYVKLDSKFNEFAENHSKLIAEHNALKSKTTKFSRFFGKLGF